MAKTGSKRTDNYIRLSDKELIDLACSGRQIAFTILFERYHNGVMAHIKAILSSSRDNNTHKKGEEPEDICQEAFNKAFRNIGSYNYKYKFSTWIYNIAKNAAIDYLRTDKNFMAESLTTDPDTREIADILAGDKLTPEENLIGQQETQQVMEAIDKLPKIYREIIYLYGVEEYGYEEIAEKAHISISTVKVRINRAKNKLAAILDNPIAQKRNRKVASRRSGKVMASSMESESGESE